MMSAMIQLGEGVRVSVNCGEPLGRVKMTVAGRVASGENSWVVIGMSPVELVMLGKQLAAMGEAYSAGIEACKARGEGVV